MTKFQKGLALFFFAGICSMPARAEVLDLNLNDESFHGQFTGPLGNMFDGANGEYQFGGLYSEDRGADVTTLNGGFLLTGDAGAQQDIKLTAGVGLRGQYTDVESFDGAGAALGGQFDLRFLGFERLGLQGSLWYQPKILSFLDSDGQWEFALDADYQILRNVSAYVGYRKLRINPEHAGYVTADDGPHLGVRFTF